MPRTSLLLLLVFWLFAGGQAACADSKAPAAPPPEKPAAKRPPVTTVRVWQPPAGLTQTPIWPGRAPDMPDAPAKPESVLLAHTPEALSGDTSEAVFDVSVPTMTVYPPKGRNTGAAMVVFPGGGFRALAITLEGTEICDWLTARGITCIVSKYRVPKSNHYWDTDCRCHIQPEVAWALQDAQRTIRLVRSQAAALKVDPGKIGVIGFSAGGYLAAQTSSLFEPAYKPVDAVDRVSSRPDFAVVVFPGHLCRRGGAFDPGLPVTARTSPTFLLQAWDDPVDEICNSTLYANALAQAGVPAEVHLFARGGHAFALRPTGQPVDMWPRLVEAWLEERGVL
jgi:acetyl esterase/lipase